MPPTLKAGELACLRQAQRGRQVLAGQMGDGEWVHPENFCDLVGCDDLEFLHAVEPPSLSIDYNRAIVL